MTPVQHQFIHDPKNGVYGDCHRACIASLLDLPITAVPHFYHDGCTGQEFNRRVQKFLATLNLVECNFYYNEDPRPFMLANNPTVYWIFGGRSKPRGNNHSVICLADQIVYDPGNAGIIGCLSNGYYSIGVISGRRLTGNVPVS